VYFWIHGGGNYAAMPANPQTPGHSIASRCQMVVVTMHYRLAELGWFTHPKLRSGKPEDALDDSGNYGLLDMIAALRWVRDNIAAFGGDPNNVFVTGESAGGQDVFCLLASQPAAGLFHRAMVQSGNPFGTPLDQADRMAARLIRGLMTADGVAQDDADARVKLDAMSATELGVYMRGKSFAELLRAGREGSAAAVSGVLDGTVLPREGFSVFERGTYPSKVPTIIGMNKEESKLAMFLTRRYRSMDMDVYNRTAAFSSDMTRVRGLDQPLAAMSAHEDQPPVYGYQLLWGYNGDGKSPIPAPFADRLGCYHALDIAFFFDVWDSIGVNALAFTEDNRPGREQLCRAMMDYVAQFARTGDPNRVGSQLPTWEPWRNGAGAAKLIEFDASHSAAQIEMTDRSLTLDEVAASVATLPEPLLTQVRAARATVDW
jgi:para-nitrobenzyl esterase